MNDEAQIREALLAPPTSQRVDPSLLLSSGSTLINLACSGHPQGAYLPGKHYFIVGDSTCGKTFLVLTCLAEAARNKRFENYNFVYDNPEDGALMDFGRFFGSEVARRTQLEASETIEGFYKTLYGYLDKGPCIYLLDSMDALSTEYELGKQQEKRSRGKQAKADFGDGKAKINSRNLRTFLPRLRKTGSILVFVCQTRDNVGAETWEDDQVFAGGHAIKFYATWQLWGSVGKSISRTYKDHTVEQGIVAKIAVKKNRLTGRRRRVEVPIYHSYGIDDIGSCIDYLLDWNRWTVTQSGVIAATELGLSGRKETIIKQIEEQGLERDLQDVVAEVWRDTEEACAISRKPRYE